MTIPAESIVHVNGGRAIIDGRYHPSLDYSGSSPWSRLLKIGTGYNAWLHQLRSQLNVGREKITHQSICMFEVI